MRPTNTHTHTHRGGGGHSHAAGHDEEVLVVEEAGLGDLHDQEVEELDEEHEEELANAAHLQEY